MIRWSMLIAVTLLACADQPRRSPPKRPNTELIVGEFERRPPVGEQAIRFYPDGEYRLAKNRAELDRSPHLGNGRYDLDGDQLKLTAEKGLCSESAGDKTGTYKVVISKVGIRFEKLDDDCEDRARMDGQTWWRIK
jgi:hypothetical protein